jgi:hypothetical protein
LLIGLYVRLPLIPSGLSATLPGAMEKILSGDRRQKRISGAHYFSGSSLNIEVYELNVARAITRSSEKSSSIFRLFPAASGILPFTDSRTLLALSE